MGIEKRRHERIPAKLEVYWERASTSRLVQITDLSLSGCFIRTHTQPAVGEIINLELRLPSGKWLTLDGVVVRCTQTGFGIQFSSELKGHVIDLINPMKSQF
jgi:hypothetical protein